MKTAGLAAALSFGLLAFTAQAQNFPTRQVTLVVPFTPGGPTDVIARLMTQKLSEAWARPVVIEYKPGAGTVIGIDNVAKSTPDGHTIGIVVSSYSINPALRRSMPYDTLRDLSGVTLLTSFSMAIAANPSVPFDDVKGLVEYAKRNPGKLAFATPGAGGTSHLSGELLNGLAGIDMMHVPYKGSAPANRGMLGGEVQFLIQSPEAVAPFLRAGKMRALATLDHTRLESMPDVPTLSQAGAKDLDFEEGWHGIYAPAKTPRDLLAVIEREVTGLVKTPEFTATLKAMNFVPVGAGMLDIARRLETEFRVWPQVVKAANIQISRE